MKNRLIQYSLVLIMILGLFAVAPLASAQISNDAAAAAKGIVSLESSPSNPGPNQNVKLTVTSFNYDLDRANISWYVNGKRISGGTGMRSFSTLVGAAGSKTIVMVKVETIEGDDIEKSKTFSAATVDLVWEAESYTPPFYKGKPLLTQYSEVRIVALPRLNNDTFASKDLIYTWSKDGRVLGSLSGYGKNTLRLDGITTAQTVRIAVSVSDRNNTMTAEDELVLNPGRPKLVTYAYSPAHGTLYNMALTANQKMETKEVSFVAVPYFYTYQGGVLPFIEYSWTMNNKPMTGVFDNILTVRNDATSTGNTSISVTGFTKIGNVSQEAKTSFTISY